jgi:Uma2 family endonuclease
VLDESRDLDGLAHASTATEEPGPLVDGQRLDQPTFHALYLQTPEKFRAELIDGVVHVMNCPVSEDHGFPDASMIGLLFFYSVATPGTETRSNATAILGPRSEVQPDSALFIDPESGGQTYLNENRFAVGAPELVVEIALTSLATDLNAKRLAYEAAGTREYVVFDATHRRFHWWTLRNGRFEPLEPDAAGIFRSVAFPGLWLDSEAFVRGDKKGLLGCLQEGLARPEHADFVARLAEERAKRA